MKICNAVAKVQSLSWEKVSYTVIIILYSEIYSPFFKYAKSDCFLENGAH